MIEILGKIIVMASNLREVQAVAAAVVMVMVVVVVDKEHILMDPGHFHLGLLRVGGAVDPQIEALLEILIVPIPIDDHRLAVIVLDKMDNSSSNSHVVHTNLDPSKMDNSSSNNSHVVHTNLDASKMDSSSSGDQNSIEAQRSFEVLSSNSSREAHNNNSKIEAHSSTKIEVLNNNSSNKIEALSSNKIGVLTSSNKIEAHSNSN